MLTSMEEKGNVVGFGLPASIEIIPGIFSSGNNPRTERFKSSARRQGIVESALTG